MRGTAPGATALSLPEVVLWLVCLFDAPRLGGNGPARLYKLAVSTPHPTVGDSWVVTDSARLHEEKRLCRGSDLVEKKGVCVFRVFWFSGRACVVPGRVGGRQRREVGCARQKRILVVWQHRRDAQQARVLPGEVCQAFGQAGDSHAAA